MAKNKKDISTGELLDAINEGFSQIDSKIVSMDSKIVSMDARITKIEATMVTKDYLDNKLADLRGDLGVLTRKEDKKGSLNSLIYCANARY
jgi:hypothetical protein